jgi:hypothetical protein
MAAVLLIGAWVLGALGTRGIALQRAQRILAAAVAVTGLAALILCLGEYLEAPFSEWNDSRLAPAAALWHGFPIYTRAGGGPILGHIRGPITAAFYVPAVLLPTPATAILFGAVMSFFMYALPALALLLLESGGPGVLPAACFVCFCLATVYEPALIAPAFKIHADAPALGFMALACAFIYTPAQRCKTGYLLASAAAAVLAAGSKQVTVSTLLVLPLYLLLTDGYRTCRHYVGLLVLAAVILAAVVLRFVDLGAMIFDTITVPSGHPWKGSGGVGALAHAFRELAHRSLPYAVIVVVGVVALGASSRSKLGMRQWFAEQRWVLPILVGLAAIPTSLAGRAKVGGDANALCYSLYFIVLGAFLVLLRAAREEDKVAGLSPPVTARVVLTILATFLAVAGLPRLSGLHQVLAELPTNPETTAYRFAREHPGQVYFPFHPLVTLMSEGRLYQFLHGVEHRELAGWNVSDEQFRAHLPPNLRYVLVSSLKAQGSRSEDTLRRLPEFRQEIPVPELPGWTVLVKETDSPRQGGETP